MTAVATGQRGSKEPAIEESRQSKELNEAILHANAPKEGNNSNKAMRSTEKTVQACIHSVHRESMNSFPSSFGSLSSRVLLILISKYSSNDGRSKFADTA